MKVQLLYFDGCPHVAAARSAVRAALTAEGLDIAIEEIDVQEPAAPAWARGWGSPTILIDGMDIGGGRPSSSSSSSSCRLYPGGAPTVELVRGAIAAAGRSAQGGRVALPLLGAIAAAVAASACCLVPAGLALVGASGVGFAAGLAPYRLLFLLATGLALAVGFWLVYRPVKDCGCAVPRTRAAARVALWITTAVATAAAVYPALGSGQATAGSLDATAKATLHLTVHGMDCRECTGPIAARLKRVAGVVSAAVDFDASLATVRHDGREGLAPAAIQAVKDAGFRAEVRP